MTTPRLDVVATGPANTVQDQGRWGHRGIGVPVGGVADPLLATCANRLLGNADTDAVIEMPLAGPTLRALGAPVRLALAGDAKAFVQRGDEAPQPVPAFQTITLWPEDALRVGAVRQGVAYLAVSGGCLVPAPLGSRSTYARAALGGVQGRALQVGDQFDVGPPRGDLHGAWHARPWVHQQGPVRIMLGPQDEAFEPDALATLVNEAFGVSRDSDRMGMRLDGRPLQHRRGADLCSEGVVPGSIQVPGNGQPIILLADAQTVGGYTKVATVIRADLPRLAHCRPGDSLRFLVVTRAEASEALAQQAAALEAWTASIAPWQAPGTIDLRQLYEANLLSGMIDARCDPMSDAL